MVCDKVVMVVFEMLMHIVMLAYSVMGGVVE